MKLNHYFLLIFIILFLGSSEIVNKKAFANNKLSGKLTINLKNGVSKLVNEKPTYQDIFIDLVCEKNQCEQEIYGWSPKYNQDVEHQGNVKIKAINNGWKLDLKLNVRPSPFTMESKLAQYQIEIVPYQKDQLIGSYTGKFNQLNLTGKVTGFITKNKVKNIANYQPIKPQEHPRLIFRKSDLNVLRNKAKTDYGKAILAQLNQSLNRTIYYDGYGLNGGFHAAGYCFLALLNDDQNSANKGWQLTQEAIAKDAPRLLEQSQVVTGVALAYDLCYPMWTKDQIELTTIWLANEGAKLIAGGGKSWNGDTVSNWNVRSRSAGGLAMLAIMDEPKAFFPTNKFWNSPDNLQIFLKTAERKVERYLDLAVGDGGFNTEGDGYARESARMIFPFLHAYQQVLGKDLITESHAAQILPNAVMRMVKQNDQAYIPFYGRHRNAVDNSIFANGLYTTKEEYLPAVLWFFDNYFGVNGDGSFGVGKYSPHDAIYALMGYRDDIVRQNPAEIFTHNFVDQQKGLFVFRNQWQDENDFVTSIYLKLQAKLGGWSFPEVSSFKITGFGTNWATAGVRDGKQENENLVNLPNAQNWRTSEVLSFFQKEDGSGIVTFKLNDIIIPKTEPPIGIRALRSFAVDYSQKSGTPVLVAIADVFEGSTDNPYFAQKDWIMHTEGKVTIKNNQFTIDNGKGANLTGVFVTPNQVKITYEKTEIGGKITATGGNEFWVVMTIQKGESPPIKIRGKSLDARVDVGKQTIRFINNRLVFEQF